MDIKSVLNFLKAVVENSTVAAVKSLKGATFTTKLESNKVEVTNPLKLPKVLDTKVTNPAPSYKADLKEISNSVHINMTLLSQKLTKQLKDLETSLKPVDAVTVTNLDTIKPPTKVEVTNLKQKIAITNLFEIAKEIGKLKKSVDDLKLNPTITVPDVIVPDIKIPDIHIPDTKVVIDLTKLEQYLSVLSNDPKNPLAVRLSTGDEFYDAIFQSVSGGTAKSYAYQDQEGERTYGLVDGKRNVRVSTDDRYGLNDQEKVGNINYLGQEDADGEWLITKIQKISHTVTMRYATVANNDMIDSYTDAWDNRATLQFGLYSEAF